MHESTVFAPKGQYAILGANNLFIADSGNLRIRRVDGVTGIITTVAGNGVFGFSGDGVLATSARLAGPVRVALDAPGNLFIADHDNHSIRRVEGTAVIAVIGVDIDIKRGCDPNSINCENENKMIAIAILITLDFDATTVDHETVDFEGASEAHVDKKSGDARRHEEDVDDDGGTDLVLHFQLGETGLTCDSTDGTLTGETFGGQAIEGTDAVRTVGG